MSWGQYISNMEQGKGRCQYAGIFGKTQVSCWAESENKDIFPITNEDVSNLIRVITAQDMNIMGTGLKIGSRLSFTCLRLETGILICQGKGDHKDYSLVVALSNQACIIGLNTDPDVKAAMLRDTIEQIRDYLCAANY